MKSRLQIWLPMIIVGAVALSCLGNNAHAVIMGAKGGTVTLDGQTGLEWLDITASTNFSYIEVQNELAAGGQFEGFRLATQNEVRTLLQNAGTSTILESGNSSNGYTTDNFASVHALQTLMGFTDSFYNVGVDSLLTYGYSADIIDVLGNDRVAMPGIATSSDGSLGFASLAQYGNRLDAPGSQFYGSWLVRDTDLPLVISYGDGSVSLDLATGRQWLDLTASTNISYQTILTETQSGGQFEAFELATGDQIEALWRHAGIVDILPSGNSSNGYTADNLKGAEYLQQLMGTTDAFFNVGIDSLLGYGYSADIIDVLGNDRVAMPGIATSTDGSLGFASLAQYGNRLDAPGSQYYGSWLVSEPIGPVILPVTFNVSEPSSPTLAIMGILILAWRFKKGDAAPQK